MLTRALLLFALAAVMAGCGSSHSYLFRLKPDHALSSAELDRSAQIIQKRLDKLKASGTATRSGSEIDVRLDQPRLPAAATIQGGLGFYDLEPSLVAGPSSKPLPPSPGTVEVTCGPPMTVCPRVGPPTHLSHYLFRNPPAMTGADLKESGTRADFDPQTNVPVVVMQFTRKGALAFHRITRLEARRGARTRHLQSFAIVFDDEIVSFPSIDYTNYPQGIAGNNGAEITGITYVEAQQIGAVLRAGRASRLFPRRSLARGAAARRRARPQ